VYCVYDVRSPGVLPPYLLLHTIVVPEPSCAKLDASSGRRSGQRAPCWEWRAQPGASRTDLLRALTWPFSGFAAAGMSQSSKKTYNTEALKSRLDQLEAALSEERTLRMKVEQDLYTLKSTSLAKPAAE